MNTKHGMFAALAAGVLCMVASMSSADAQYFQPARSGYLPPGQQPVYYTSGPMTQRPVPLRLGGALGAGPAVYGFRRLDDAFFQPNQASRLERMVPAAIDLSGWLEFNETFRIGAHGMMLFGGDRNTYASAGSGGLLLEVGGGQGWRLFGGAVLGVQHLYASSHDASGRRFEYNADYFHVRVHAHLERELSPWLSVRVTPFASMGTRFVERFFTPTPGFGAVGVVVPDRSDHRLFTAGLLFSLSLQTGY